MLLRLKVALAAGLLAACALSMHAQQAQPAADSSATVTLRVTSDLVLTNIVVRDRRTGQPVQGLTRDDFTVLEDGKPQQITTFDYQDASAAAPLSAIAARAGSGRPTLGSTLDAAAAEQLTGHRLIVLFLDTTSLQPDDLERVQAAARDYVQARMQAADLVAVVSLGNTLSVDQDFTADKSLLLHAIASYSPGGQQGFIPGPRPRQTRWKIQQPSPLMRPITTT